jgi:Uma2 family endonuclease
VADAEAVKIGVRNEDVSAFASPAVSSSRTASPDGIELDDLFRLSVEQYHAMIQAGILTPDDSVELLEGLLVTKMPKNPPHVLVKRLLRRALESVVGKGFFVDQEDPVTIKDSEPEPDVTVFRGDPRTYRDRHAGPGDTVLVAEVADTSLRRDRGRKKRIYAKASVPVYWIVNLVDQQIEVYTEPTGPTKTPDYRLRHEYHAKDAVPVVIDGKEVGRLNVSDLLR